MLTKPRSAMLLAALLSFVPAKASADGNTRLEVRDVKLASLGQGEARVSITTSAEPRFFARVDSGGKRLVIDVSGAEIKGAPAAITQGNALVGGVLTQTFDQDGKKITRVLVQLARTAEYRISATPTGLVVDLAAADATAPMRAPAPVVTSSSPSATTPKAEARKVEQASGAAVTNVRYDHQAGKDRVTVELNESVKFSHVTSPSGRSILELEGARLPDALERKLDVSAFGGTITAISTYRRKSDSSRVVVEVEPKGDAIGVVSREGSTLVLTFADTAAHPMLSGVGADGGAARRVRTVAREEDVLATPSTSRATETTIDGEEAAGFLPTTLAQQRRFTGRRIDLDLKDADVHNVLRLISDVGRVNIVTSDDVKGNVTIRMRNVPWDQALETVLQAKGLGMVRQGNMIRVAPQAELNKERELDLARRRSELALAPLETRLIPVNYAVAKELQARGKDLLSPRGSLAVDERTNVLVARDVAGNLDQLEELVRALDTQTPQVLIEARIVEATSRYLRDVGIQWGGDGTFSPATGNPTGLVFPSQIGLTGGASDQTTPTGGLSPFQNTVPNPNFAVNLPATTGTGLGGAIGMTLGSIDNTVNLSVRLSAAEASGLLRIVSSPRILTLDNREARISQGTLIPFSQISAQGVQTTFQEAKLQLLVKPHVTSDGSVSMHVKINRDEPDFNQTSARGDPTILKREAETDLLIMDGHTAVIGGIFTRNTGRNLDQVPVLGDIPILGVLFQRRRSSDSRSELVIFITPRIVNRAESLGK
ncbi:type IV pilus secretin PilQ [Polyangium jinanense]|uniref:Type IV pilus secretin PilQ n=1 Tax=Polyangium jinanense TaxID=2829994 RepID=A0A9X4ARQ5_9BACT|nr:type IV pilus secretin PilQ [Polyangium jinanense]MDC3955671.1 type IV pilus secretin PilQ [Polyangium jinanense]MDC3982313.1 type IV pilus secretin PilQ [Polyangium jinanense]